MSFHDLQQYMAQALVQEHPEWVLPDGKSPILETYLSRFAELMDSLKLERKSPLPQIAY